VLAWTTSKTRGLMMAILSMSVPLNANVQLEFRLTDQFGECVATSRWPQKEDNVSGSKTWKYGVVNNYKVQEALAKPGWMSSSDTDYGQAAEMVYRLLTIPMEYSTFATTAQLSENQDVANDVNLEFRMSCSNRLPSKVMG
jgi:hypothetical protein